jgi:uncharacterized protein
MLPMTIPNLRRALLKEGAVAFSLRIRPGARSTAWGKALADGTLALSLHAPAQDNKANTALVRFLADEFSVPIRNIFILRGHASRTKYVRIMLNA